MRYTALPFGRPNSFYDKEIELPVATSPPPAIENVKENSKDFIEHLRTVHFALIATCLALIVIGISPSSKRLENASKQLAIASDLSKAPIKEWVRDEASRYANHNETCLTFAKDSRAFQVRMAHGIDVAPPWIAVPTPIDSPEPEVNLWFTQRAYRDFVEALYDQIFRGIGAGKSDYDEVKVNNLTDFRTVWDTTFTISCPVATATRTDDRWTESDWLDKIDDDKAIHGDTSLSVRAVDSRKNPLDQFSYAHKDKSGKHLLVNSVLVSSKTVSMNAIFRQHFPEKHLPYESFREAFYDLDQATMGIQNDASLSLVRRTLELQAKSSGESFEIFGQKFPVESASRWGILIVVGIQFYFLLHYVEFRSRRFPSISGAWIGAYKSSAARSLFSATTFIAPVCVVAFLCARGSLLPPEMIKRNIALGLVAVLISALLAYLTARTYFRKDHEIPFQPAAKAAGS